MSSTSLAPVAIATAVILLQYFYFMMMVGKARGDTGVKAPAVTGDPIFERHFRVHQNSLEQLIMVLPALWLFAIYVHVEIAAAIALVYVIGRFWYRASYINDPSSRAKGFVIGFFATVVLLFGGLIGAVLALVSAA